MKIYGLLLLIFVIGLLAGCAQTVPTGTTTTNNDQNSQNPASNNTQTTTTTTINTTTNTQTTTTTTSSAVSTSELATHNSGSDCWVGYNGKVYDITKWLPIHPGGPGRITPYCGTSSQFEQAFTNKHGTMQVGRLMQQGIYEGDLQ